MDAGSEKMEQLDKRERDENAVDAPKTQAAGAGAELPDTKNWSTPGNRRMILNRDGISFVNSLKGRLNVRSGGIRVWTNGNMALEAKEIAGGGQKITAEAGDYVWIGSGPSGMVLLPDQIHISAVDVYMKSPLNWIHKIIDEETTETLLDLYEEMKTAAPPIYAPDGTLIRRDGYDDILYSEELYDYFLNHVVGKEEKYKRENGEPSGEEPHILVSNFFGEHQGMQYHQDLYHKRWSIETKYGELKTRARLENFSGKNPRAIRQDVYAALFISNLSALVKPSAENEIREELDSGRHKYQLNRIYIIGAVSRYIRCLADTRCYKNKLQRLVQRAKNVRSIIRPDRHFKRKASHHGITNGFCIRVNL